MDISCIMHGDHLVMKGGLTVMDRFLARIEAPFKFYSGLAKLIHVWRDNCRKYFIEWIKAYGCVSANKFAKSLPPKCLSGRWGAVCQVVKLLRAAGKNRVRNVTLKVIGNEVEHAEAAAAIADAAVAMPVIGDGVGEGAAVAPGEAVAVAAQPNSIAKLDDPELEEADAHRERQGRWKKDTVVFVKSDIAWETISICHRASQPLDHHLRFCQKRLTEFELMHEGGLFTSWCMT